MPPAPGALRPVRPAMPDQPPPLDRPPASPPRLRGAKRLPWLALGKVALVTSAALASLAATWLRWINPFVDSGREMNVPARLAAGERLYRDVVYYYGPAGPWLQALALRVSGSVGPRPRLPLSPAAALFAGHTWLPLEIACLALAAAILFLLYRLAAAAGGPRSALAATTRNTPMSANHNPPGAPLKVSSTPKLL